MALIITVPGCDFWDEVNERFITRPSKTLKLEHSLVSVSKWEAIWHVPFLDERTEKNMDQTISYVKCMTITQNVDDEVYQRLTNENFEEISKYIQDPMTATWFGDEKRNGRGRRRGRIVTSELIYYWMSVYNLPIEFEKWHINRLITLIRVCEEETAAANGTGKKRRRGDMSAEYARINAERQAAAARAKAGHIRK